MYCSSLPLQTKASLYFRDHWGYVFLLPAFSSHLLCTLLQEAGLGFSDVCVCVWEREGGVEGLKQAEGCRSYSLSILGSGREVGSTEETWPPPPFLLSPSSLLPPSILLLFLVFPLPPFVCPSLRLCLPIHRVFFFLSFSVTVTHVCEVCVYV